MNNKIEYENSLGINDDNLANIFTFLDPRDMCKSSSTCKTWRQIFQSDSVQTNEIKLNIRWAKYANHNFDSRQLLFNDGYKLHFLKDGSHRFVRLRTDPVEKYLKNQPQPGSHAMHWVPPLKLDEFHMELYSIRKEGDIVLEASVKVDREIEHFASNDSNDLVTVVDFGEEKVTDKIQIWKITKDSKIEKVSDYEFDEFIGFDDVSISASGKIYCYGEYTDDFVDSVLIVDPENPDDAPLLLDDYPFDKLESSSDLTFSGNMVFFCSKEEIFIYSMESRKLMVKIKCHHKVMGLRIENICGKDRLISGDSDGHFRIYSIEDGSLLHTQLHGVDENFGEIRGDYLLCASECCGQTYIITEVWSGRMSSLKLWRAKVTKEGSIETKEQETIISNVGDFRTFGEMKFLPDGRILRETFHSLLFRDTGFVYVW